MSGLVFRASVGGAHQVPHLTPFCPSPFEQQLLLCMMQVQMAQIFLAALRMSLGRDQLNMPYSQRLEQGAGVLNSYADSFRQSQRTEDQQIAQLLDWTAGRARRAGDRRTGCGSAEDFVQAALNQRGDRYVYGAEARKGDHDPDAFDCSELVEWAADQAGVDITDGSAAQRRQTTPISVDEALNTRGALLFRDGHVAISLGDGENVVEARGAKYGVGVFSARSRSGKHRFTSGGLIPGMRY